MSRKTLFALGPLLIIFGITSLIGRAAAWATLNQPNWLSWLMIVIGVISLIIAAADYENGHQ